MNCIHLKEIVKELYTYPFIVAEGEISDSSTFFIICLLHAQVIHKCVHVL